MRLRWGLLAAWILSLGLPAHLRAQAASLLVRVQGPTGPIPSAEVEISWAGSSLARGWTDDAGEVYFRPVPAGTYQVHVEGFGYESAEEEGVRVDPGVQRNLNVFLAVAPIELEGLKIGADRIRIERETMDFATQVGEAAMTLLPISREARELVALTPGARPDHVWGGASAQANSYRIDGLSMDHPGIGSDLFQPSPTWIEKVEVRGLAAGAEYGGFQGGLVDVATKSGSNRVEGSIRSTLEHDGLTGSNLVKTEIGREVSSRMDVEGEVGGPIIRSRLTYYLAGQRVRQDSRALNHLPQVTGRYSPLPEERTEERYLGKLSWTPSRTTQVEISAAHTNVSTDNHGVSGYELAGATERYSAPAWLLNLTAQTLLGPNVQLEGRVNHLRLDERTDAYGGPKTPGITHYSPTPPEAVFGNAPLSHRSAPRSTSASFMATIRKRMGGQDHSLKVGGEYTQGSFLDERVRNGGMTWIPLPGETFTPHDPRTWAESPGAGIPTLWGGEVRLDADVANAALFAQASIAIGNRVNLSSGLRWAQWTGWITPSSGNRFRAVRDAALDPRLGISFDLTGRGTLVAKAHWGRYHQKLISQMFDRAGGADVFSNEEFWEYRGDPPADPTHAFTVAERDSLAALGVFRKLGETVLNETGRVEQYRQPYVEQWLVGLEKKIGSSAKFEILYARRSNKDMVALVDRNRASNYTVFDRVRPLRPDGYYVQVDLTGMVFEKIYIPNYMIRERLRCKADGSCPDALPIPGMTAADTLGLTWSPDYVLTTAPGAKREFAQIQTSLEISRPRWGATFSYVLTDLKGNFDNVSGYTDPRGLGPGPWVRVNEMVNRYGPLANFSAWEIKASVWGTLPWGLRGGLFWTWRTGDRYSTQFRLTGMGDNRYWVGQKGKKPPNTQAWGELDYTLFEPLEGHFIYVAPRGFWILERQSIADLRLEKTLPFGSRRMAVSLDVFNLLRCEAKTEVNGLLNHSAHHWRFGVEEWGGIPSNERHQASLNRVRPQTVRIGVLVHF